MNWKPKMQPKDGEAMTPRERLEAAGWKARYPEAEARWFSPDISDSATYSQKEALAQLARDGAKETSDGSVKEKVQLETLSVPHVPSPVAGNVATQGYAQNSVQAAPVATSVSAPDRARAEQWMRDPASLDIQQLIGGELRSIARYAGSDEERDTWVAAAEHVEKMKIVQRSSPPSSPGAAQPAWTLAAFVVFNSGFAQFMAATKLKAEEWVRHYLADSPEVEIKEVVLGPVSSPGAPLEQKS